MTEKQIPNPALYRAKWVLPMNRPPIEDGAVMVRGLSIDAVGRYRDLSTGWPKGAIVDLGETVVLPGLVNCHTHTDNSALAGGTRHGGGDMLAWIEQQGAAWIELSEQEKELARRNAWQQLPDYGTVSLADIASHPYDPADQEGAPLWASVFYEVRGFGRGRAGESLRRARALQAQSTRAVSGVWTRFGVAPHGPHSVHKQTLAAIAERCIRRGDVLSMHVAESEEEVALLQGSDHRFAEALKRWGFWEEDFNPPGTTPVRYLDRFGAVGPELLAVHCVHLEDGEISLMAEKGATACLCPRSNAWIGVGLPPLEKLLKAGVRCVLGTDGLGSVETLSMFDEMAFVSQNWPGIAPRTILQMATNQAAAALRMDSLLGVLDMNTLARFLVFSGDCGADPEEALVNGIDHKDLQWAGGEIDLRK